MRFRVESRDVPPEMAARRMGITLAYFEAKLSNLIARGFPSPDPDTGNFDLDAIDEWRKRRHPALFAIPAPTARDARTVGIQARIAGIGRG